MIGVWIAALFIAIALIAGCASVLRKDERRADLSYKDFMRKHMTRGYFADCGEADCPDCGAWRRP